jgi:PleD family two-component response regulator
MANKRLLLIEDDYDVAEMLQMYFASHEFEVLHADNGADGIDLARTKFPVLVLLDVMLPDMDGYDICIRLRQTSLTKYIPIIFLTQRDERAAKVRGLELGADDYITKPFDIDELRLRVQGSIRRATRESLHEPRTGLPTGPLVDEEIARRQHNHQAYSELLLGLEGFPAYSDVYGFMAANDVLHHAGKTIQQIVAERGTPDDFVGILKDEFIVLTHAKDVPTLDEAIKQKFADEVRTFYSFLDADRGGLVLNEGTPEEQFVPMMRFATLSREGIGGS